MQTHRCEDCGNPNMLLDIEYSVWQCMSCDKLESANIVDEDLEYENFRDDPERFINNAA